MVQCQWVQVDLWVLVDQEDQWVALADQEARWVPVGLVDQAVRWDQEDQVAQVDQVVLVVQAVLA